MMTASDIMTDTLTDAIMKRTTGHAGMKMNVAFGIMTGGNGMMRAGIMIEMTGAMTGRMTAILSGKGRNAPQEKIDHPGIKLIKRSLKPTTQLFLITRICCRPIISE